MKESKKKLIGLLATVGVCTVVLVGTAFAWYNGNTRVEVSNLKVGVVNAYDLRFSLDGYNFGYNLGEDFNLAECKQVTGNGTDFYKINTGLGTADSDGVQHLEITGYEKIAEADYGDYLYYKEVHLTVEKNIVLKLDRSSSIVPANTNMRKNEFNVSRDYIAGAIRFGIMDASGESDVHIPLFVWAPNSKYEYSESGSTKTFTTNGNVEESYSYATGTHKNDVESIDTELEANGSVTTSSGFTFAWGDILASNQTIRTIEAGRTTLAFAVWLEGTDRECVLDFSGGEVNITLNFTSELA